MRPAASWLALGSLVLLAGDARAQSCPNNCNGHGSCSGNKCTCWVGKSPAAAHIPSTAMPMATTSSLLGSAASVLPWSTPTFIQSANVVALRPQPLTTAFSDGA